MNRLILVLFFTIVLFATHILSVHTNDEGKDDKDKPKKIQSKFSKPIDINKIEKAWKSGDEAEELEEEFEVTKKVSDKKNKKKKNGQAFDPQKLAEQARKDPLAFMGGGGGTAMLFVELKQVLADGSPWKKKDVDNLAMKWSSLMKSGSLPGTVYNVGDQKASSDIDKEPKVLVTLDKNWMTKELMRFLLTQPETVKVSKDSRDFTKADLKDDDEDDEF